MTASASGSTSSTARPRRCSTPTRSTTTTSLNVQQAYVSYLAPREGLTFEVGKFVTPIGTEPTESNLNFNYSRTFLYRTAPSTTSVRASRIPCTRSSRWARCS